MLFINILKVVIQVVKLLVAYSCVMLLHVINLDCLVLYNYYEFLDKNVVSQAASTLFLVLRLSLTSDMICNNYPNKSTIPTTYKGFAHLCSWHPKL